METSGDGAVNFQSRVQMVPFKARQAAEAEMRQALHQTGLDRVELGRLLERMPRLRSPLAVFGHRASVTSANLAYAVAESAPGGLIPRAARRRIRLPRLWYAAA